MSVAEGLGNSGRTAVYEVPDNDMAVGSTLGGPRASVIIKANGSIQTIFSPDIGVSLFGTIILRHFDEESGMYLAQDKTGSFIIHPEHQEHFFTLAFDVGVRENIFVLSGMPQEDGSVDPPGAYYCVELENRGASAVTISTYAFADLRGESEHDVQAEFDEKLCALIAWNKSKPDQVRLFGCSERPASYEVSMDYALAVTGDNPGKLANQTIEAGEPMGVLHHTHRIEPKKTASFYYLLSFGTGRGEARKNYRGCPNAHEALERTKDHYHEILSRAVVFTPNPYINRGVLWAKANMLRVETKSPTGWAFVNDPTRSNNSVARDTSWFAYGSDYMTPHFSRESLLAYVRNQEKNGMVVEYYDIRNGKTADYGLNINDNTPLLILALWHHYNTSGNEDFLCEVYPHARRAARYILSQLNDQGLVWCTSEKTSDWGIVGWRNVIEGYRLSGATTEVNSECYAALKTVSHMARILGKHEESSEFHDAAGKLREAINEHLYNPKNGLYYLNIDIDGKPRSDITSDLVFPVMFGVADEDTSASIIRRLSNQDFWTTGGMRTTPRDAWNYTPRGGWGLLGGVWVGVSFWYAFAAADYTPQFMDNALGESFHNYSTDPRRNNTVPGQFSEWLHGETLVNEGMMLSPWFPPRYLWAAIEGCAGLEIDSGDLGLAPRLAPNWKWLGVQNLPFRGRSLTWFAVRIPDVQIYTNFHVENGATYRAFEEDISTKISAGHDAVCALGFRQGANLILFAGNTSDQTISTSMKVQIPLKGSYRVRAYESFLGRWKDKGLMPAERLQRGVVLHIEHKGFALADIEQEL
jgi:hypothetical protein